MRFLAELLVASTLVACAIDTASRRDDDDGVITIDAGDSTGPDSYVPGSWRHSRSKYVVQLGSPHHRGIDLIASDDAPTQVIGGRVTYGPTDKDLEDEDVDVFANSRLLGRATTDDEGRFTLQLTGAQRLPIGMHDLTFKVVGDGTGVTFNGFVARRGQPVIVSDVDGTLTAYENAYPESLALGGDVGAQASAAEKLSAAAANGAAIVYITARGDRFTQDTRDWLAAKGFPRGAVRMPSSLITIPGDDTVEAKARALAELAPFSLQAGLGNRHSDVMAYTGAGLPADRIFIKLPEYSDEVAADLAAAKAVGVDDYATLPF
jgi:phosphatidate phosphatase PAH1